MKKRLTKITAIIALAALLGGCYPSGKTETPSDSAVGGKEQSGVSSEGSEQGGETPVFTLPDDIEFDLNLPENAPDKIPSVTLKLKTWDIEGIRKMFFDGKKLTDENEHDEKFYPGRKMYYWETADISVVIGPDIFYYDDKAALGGRSQYGTVLQYSFADNSLTDDCYASDEELSAFSREDAKKRVGEMLKNLGINNLSEPRIISFHAELANKILPMFKEWKDNAGEPFEYTPWTENEEVYILRYSQKYENTELASMGVEYPYPSDGGFMTRDPGIIAAVTKDKIIQLQCMSIYEESYDAGESFPVDYSAEQAVGKLKEYLSNIVPNESTTTKYYGCKLVYIPYVGTEDNLTVSFKPAWEIAGYSTWKLLEDDVDDPDFYYYTHRGQENEYIWADTGHRYTPS